ncbi:putative SnoaL-like aldol condensation-catalyzing enzyme [Nocardia transvalensis]|uniref:Putative SnoaL-like aldol condensation-catalyzing enzyme n=1 Tax=Nocardia transvalensis TaxID=37333 RepID=A0A7W9PCU1_9NOCA|nr:nuclear transport factor 2 family protein [Nocardia transvalensis]MBB5913764.1 putative SnoaL-like aldol condensation-catalyzing enzyme [Nocardia transvalensis]
MTVADRISRIDANRAVVLELYRRLGAGDLDGAFALLHEDFVSHNPRVPHDPERSSGRRAFRDFFDTPAGRSLAAADQDVLRVVAGDDLVAVHLRSTAAGAETAIVDLLLVRDGLIAEHWDVVQPVPAALPHPHGMF